MNCPVCKRKIEFSIPEEDSYYDCRHCQSSLLFSKGECHIIHAEQRDTMDSAQEKTKSHLTDNTNSIKNQNIEENFDEKADHSLPEEGAKQIKTSFTKSDGAEENFNTAVNHKTQEKKLDSKIQNKPSGLENKKQEENFYPNEKTEVPELTANELEEPVIKDSELKEPSYNFEEAPEKADPINFQEKNEPPSTDQGAGEDFSDVAEFAKNQEENTKGLYLYDLTLSQINSQSLKDEVLTVLKDSYLDLSIEENSLNLKDILNKGQIKIPRISPIQTYIIVHSLMGLPLNIQWEQHHIADE